VATTTSVYAWPVPELTDSPNAPQQISDLADAIEATVGGTTVVGLPASALTAINNSAWTTFASVSFSLATAQQVEIVGWARLTNTGATRAMVNIQILDGSTFLMGIGETHMGGTGDSFGDEVTLVTPRRKFGLAAGAHIINLQGWKDANGVINMKKVDGGSSGVTDCTGLEVSY